MKTRISLLLVLAMLVLCIPGVVAQEPPHPPTTGHGATGNQSPGNGAPVGDGIYIMLIAAAAYLPVRQARNRSK